MSEYWKSNPRKFCDFCKCWIADNKPSVDFHERGKRHKESVQTRLAEMGRKGQEDYEAKLQEEDFLKSMEEAAMKAYKDDIEKNPDMTGVKISEIAKASNAKLVVGEMKVAPPPTATATAEPDDATPKLWHEAKSPDGSSYYWHTQTGECTWDVPKEDFVTVKEQERQSNKTKAASRSASTDQPAKTHHKKAKTTVSAQPVTFGPVPKAEAYSSWRTIETKETKKKVVDLQLPEIAEEPYYGPEVVISRPEVSFKEKVVTLSDPGQGGEGGKGSVGFRKRKAQQDNRKIMQRRNDL